MNWGKCPICGIRGFMTHHKCPPRWECVPEEAVSYADEEDVWRDIYAKTSKEAAEKYADWSDSWSSEYPAVQTVAVRSSDHEIEVYDVILSSMPVYTANKANPVPANRPLGNERLEK